MTPDQTPDSDQGRYTITEAAVRLGISREALRLRIRRGKVLSAKSGGVWYVYLPADTRADSTPDMTPDSDQGALMAQLHGDLAEARGEIGRLWEELQTRRLENERKDAIILALSQRPALPEPRTETVIEMPDTPQPPASTPARRGWLSRLLGR